jgi:hypothetical protein
MNFLKILSLYVAVCLAGCTSTFVVKREDFGTLRPGEQVEIETDDGEFYRIDIGAVTEDGIGGNGYYITYDEIAKISRKETDPEETTSLIVAIVLYVGISIYLAQKLFDDVFDFGE